MDNCGIHQDVTLNEPATVSQLSDAVSTIRTELGVKTIVIGFGDDIDPVQLNAIAGTGGTTYTSYLNAANGNALNAVMEDVGKEFSVSCSYDIGEQDPKKTNLDMVNVRFDGIAVPRDDGCAANTGWNWTDESRTAIEFCESACATLKTGTVSHVTGEIACKPEDVIIVV